ncbi:Krueppel-like factor 7 isoform X1 [Lates japonicus]|uniref:Krueppel-like factor 7 isoform X1 n=1 Tax=Lates japonicus TaxID=270547 RepID=A0AAD3N0U5_LATJO|nr:Krueppel-like factor 7 isoform X1 [Lates japonicus]
MRILLPTQTRFVTPGSTELHFYSDRHVRDRVRLHLRRVTENNNTERRTRETTTARIISIDRSRVEAERAGEARRLPRKRAETTDIAEESA